MTRHSHSPPAIMISEKLAMGADHISCCNHSIGDAAGHRGRDVDRQGGLTE